MPRLKILVLAAALTGCMTTPETGRRQLILFPAEQMTTLGLQSFQDIKKQTPVSRDAAANAILQRVGQRIAAVADLQGAQWEFVLFESRELNAFCLPGGKVGVYTGILPVTRDEAGLAAVIGHEVAHAVLRHGNERMSTSTAVQGIGALVGGGIAAYSSNPRAVQAFQGLYGVASGVGLELPHSRDQESEADRVGLRYMARAGYDPESALDFWQRFAAYNGQQGGKGTPGFPAHAPDGCHASPGHPEMDA